MQLSTLDAQHAARSVLPQSQARCQGLLLAVAARQVVSAARRTEEGWCSWHDEHGRVHCRWLRVLHLYSVGAHSCKQAVPLDTICCASTAADKPTQHAACSVLGCKSPDVKAASSAVCKYLKGPSHAPQRWPAQPPAARPAGPAWPAPLRCGSTAAPWLAPQRTARCLLG